MVSKQVERPLSSKFFSFILYSDEVFVGMDMEGLYRISGQHSVIHNLLETFKDSM